MTFIETLMRKVTKVHKFKPGDMILEKVFPGFKNTVSELPVLVLETNEEDTQKAIFGYQLLVNDKRQGFLIGIVDMYFELVQRNSSDRL